MVSIFSRWGISNCKTDRSDLVLFNMVAKTKTITVVDLSKIAKSNNIYPNQCMTLIYQMTEAEYDKS